MVWPVKPSRLLPLDPSSPRVRGLVHDWTLHAGIERSVIDLGMFRADGVFGTGSGGTTGNIWRPTQRGHAIVIDNTGTGTVASTILNVGDSAGSGSPKNGAYWSVAAWIYLASGGVNQIIYASTATASITFRTNSSDQLEVVATAAAVDGASSGSVPTGAWAHVAATYDGATLRFWINGLASGTASVSRTYDTTNQYRLAQDGYGEYIQNGGMLGSVRVWNRPLSAAEIGADCRDPWGIYRTPLIASGWRRPRKFFGQAGATAYTLTAEAGSFALTGNAAALKLGRKITAASGAFTLTGSAAGLYRGYRLTAAVGSFTLTGGAATFPRTYRLAADAGGYTLTGNAAGLNRGLLLTAAAGSYSLTGNTAGLYHGYRLAADAGSYSLTGNDATLIYSGSGDKTIVAEAGSFALTGGAAGLYRGYRLVAEAGSYTLTGNAATLNKGRMLTAEAGSYTLSGGAATFARTYRLVAGSGSFALTGNAVTFTLAEPVTRPRETDVTAGGFYISQPLDATLSALSALVTSADKLIRATGADAFDLITIAPFAVTLIDDADATAARATLGLGDAALSDASDFLAVANNLSDVASAASARGNLGLQPSAADKLLYGTGATTLGETDFTAVARQLLDDATFAAMRATLSISGAYRNALQQAVSVSGGAIAINCNSGTVVTVTLDAAGITLNNPTNAFDGAILRLHLTQDGTGSRTITAVGSKIKFPGGTIPTLSSAAGAKDLWIGHYNSAADLWLITQTGAAFA